MKVKRYVGDTIQDTIFKVKADLGSEAIILDTKKYKKGGFMGLFGKKKVEVVAALEDREPNFNSSNENNNQTIQEINDLKKKVDNLNKSWQKEAFLQKMPDELSNIYQYFIEQGIERNLAREIITELEEEADEDYLNLARKKLEKIIGKSAPIKLDNPGKVVALVGPTGGGKTTTIAKLAASFSLQQEAKVALLTSDTYRIAAVQQLRTYSDIINIPLKVAYNEGELEDIIKNELNEYDLVLIDTAGSSWNDKLQMGRLKKFTSAPPVDEVHLLLSMNLKNKDLQAVVQQFSTLKPDKFILTKLDETTTYGGIINLKNNYSYPLSYITYGQDVPDDFDQATPELILDYLFDDYVAGVKYE